MFWVFLFLFLSLHGEEPSPIAHFESGASTLAGGYVNILTGGLVLSDVDLAIPGIEPFHFSRTAHYDANIHTNRKSWDVKAFEFLTYRREYEPFLGERRERYEQNKHYRDDYIVTEETQALLGIGFECCKKENKKYFELRTFGAATTNFGHGKPSGKTALKNCSIEKYAGGALLTTGEGKRKKYRDTPENWFYVTYEDTRTKFLLDDVFSPNGFQTHYSYNKKSELQHIRVSSPSGKEAGQIDICKQSAKGGVNSIRASLKDGRYAELHYVGDFLKKVERSDAPTVSYAYGYYQPIGLLTEITYPQSRGVQFTYWAEGDRYVEGHRDRKITKDSYQRRKISEIRAPVGADATLLATHKIQYFRNSKHKYDWSQGNTRVLTSYGHVDDYFFDNRFLLQEIFHYTNPHWNEIDFAPFLHQHHCDFRERFSWSPHGEIVSVAHCTGVGIPLRLKHYQYDESGNVTDESLYGPLTGSSTVLPEISTGGCPVQNGCEAQIKHATFSKDGYNLLLSESLPSGLEIRYAYLPSTNLLKEKTTLANGEVLKEEFFSYDEDHCLIETIEKTALVTLIERIVPSKTAPFGLPLEKSISAVSPEGETLLTTVRYTYSSRGNLLKEEKLDAEGHLIFAVENTFDLHGNCISENNSYGHVVSRVFDENDNCIIERGPRPGFEKQCRFDYMNRCVQETYSYNGESWTAHHAYNRLNQRSTTYDFLGHATDSVRDRYGRIVEAISPEIIQDGQLVRAKIRRSFDPFGNETTTIDPLGTTTTRKYTAHNLPYEILHPDGSLETILYSLDGLPLEVTDGDGSKTTLTYDPLGRLLSKKTIHGEERYFYTGLHLVKKIDPEDVETHYTYDCFGRLSETRVEDRVEKCLYDLAGKIYRREHYENDVLLSSDLSFQDPFGRVIESYLEDPSGEIFDKKQLFYDEVGNCIEERHGCSYQIKTFDGQNRITSVTDNEGHVVRTFYTEVVNSFGQRLLEKRVVDPNGQQVITTYDSLGRESTIIHLNPLGEEIRSKQVFYDLAGHIIKEESKQGEECRLLIREFDVRGRPIALIEPLKKISRMSYTSTGQLSVFTKPDGIKLVHTYEHGRLTDLQSSDKNLHYSYFYNAKGELLQILDNLTGKTSSQTFSRYGDLTEEILPTGEKMTYTYDGLRRITSYSLPDGGSASIAYNARSATAVKRLSAEGEVLYEHAYLTFNEIGNVTKERLIDGSLSTLSYDKLYQVSELNHSYFKESNFLYDPAGNLLSFDQQGEKLAFSYDNLYQLTKENGHSYSFDAFQNRRSKDNNTYHVNELNELLDDGTGTYSYDPNGNLIELQKGLITFRFTYDPLNRLLSIEKDSEKAVFTYDPFNRRLTRNGEPFHYFRENEIGFGDELRILGQGFGADIGAAIALELDGVTYAPLHDHQGSIVGLITLDGLLANVWSFTAYGEAIGTPTSPWTFASKRVEPLTGWLSFGRRDYDPSTGRWTTPDPLGFEGGLNLYTYVFNRPLTHRDPLGLSSEDIFAASEHFFESVWEFLTDIFEPIERGIMACIDFFTREERGTYPTDSFMQIFNGENLATSDKVLYYINGMGVSLEEFDENCRYILKMRPDAVLVARYNPSNGQGIGNFCRDLCRAYKGVRGDANQDLVKAVQGDFEFIFDYAKNNAKVLVVPHSEGNVFASLAIEQYDSTFQSSFTYLGVAPARYLNREKCSHITYLTTTNDYVPWVDRTGRKKADKETLFMVRSKELFYCLDHDFQSPTIANYLKQGIDSFYETGRISLF